MNEKKKKFKISDSEMRLILLLLAILLLALGYFVGYNKTMTMAQEIEAQNAVYNETVKKLESMVSRQAEVEQDTANRRQNIQDIIEKYPSNLTTEKIICIIQDMENTSGAMVSNISFQLDTTLRAFTAVSGDTETLIPPTGMYAAMSMNYVASYENYQQMVYYINSMKDRSTVPAISAAYDQTIDMVSGVMTVNMYYLTNTGKEYEAPDPGFHTKGVESIFGAGDGIIEENGEEEEAEEAGAEE